MMVLLDDDRLIDPMNTLGSFTGNKTRQEIAAIRGTTTLEISMLDEEGHLIPLVSQPTFSNLRSLAMIRPVGGSKVSQSSER